MNISVIKTIFTHQRRFPEYVFPLSVFLFAFLMRLIYLLEYQADPLFHFPQIDAESYVSLAKQMAHGTYFTVNTYSFYQPPLYALLLAALFKLVTENLFTIHLLQFLQSAVNCVLIYVLGKLCFNRKIGWLAGTLAGCYWPFIYFAGELLTPTLSITLLLGFLIFFCRYIDSVRKKYLFFSGLLLGLTALSLPTILLFGWIACPVYIVFRHRRQALNHRWSGGAASVLVYLAACWLVMAPVTLYNWHVEKVFVPISHNGGINFYIGNSPWQENAIAIRPGEEWEDFVGTPQRKSPQTILSTAAVSRYWYHKSLEHLHHNPGEFITNKLQQTVFFFDAYEIKRNMDIYFFRERFSRLMKWPLPGFGLAAPLALVGLLGFGTVRSKVRFLMLFMAIYAFSVVLFFVAARYRLPVLSVLLIFSSRGFFKLWESLKNRPISWKPILILALAFFMINADIFNSRPTQPQRRTSAAESWYYLGRALADKARCESDQAARAIHFMQAIKAMQTASSMDSSFAYPYIFTGIYLVHIAKDLIRNLENDAPEAQEKTVLADQVLHNLDLAERNYRRAIILAPRLLSPPYNLCLTLLYCNIIEYNYSTQTSENVKKAVMRRCDEIDFLVDDLLARNTAEKEKYLDIRLKSTRQKQAIAEWKI